MNFLGHTSTAPIKVGFLSGKNNMTTYYLSISFDKRFKKEYFEIKDELKNFAE
jgi:hypothetical protein